MKIVIAGDTLPKKINMHEYEEGNAELIFGKELMERFASADYSIVNLEGSFTDGEEPIEKSGGHLKGSKKAFAAVKALGVKCASLANNHICDYGDRGVLDTIEQLESSGMDWVGAGKDRESMRRSLIKEIDGCRVGIYSCAATEFNIAESGKAGVNTVDLLDTPDEIAALKEKCDLLICIYHGGRELYRYPTPLQQRFCRKLAEKGADVVLCQHSHCIGCMEEYKGATILYGQGNFSFHGQNDELRHSGLLLTITKEGEELKLEPEVVVNADGHVNLAGKEEADAILSAFRARNEEIRREGFVQERFTKLAEELYPQGMQVLSGRFGKKLWHEQDGWLQRKFYRHIDRRHILNMIRNEENREFLVKGLEEDIRKNKDQ
ncbi:MAG: CapA family protein [Lachnospiraceae bacterium]|nr:CapA family protein [Lachnospiraceae bacterium]